MNQPDRMILWSAVFIGSLCSMSFAATRAPDQEVPYQLEKEFKGTESTLVESTLEPEEIFHRVPLNPPMSQSNWTKWAGPMLEKRYKVQKGDTLWKISEKLFGTPYLWPKIWQLNAIFGNAHIIEPGTELRFNPGNPNAAPGFAVELAKKANFDYGEVDVSFAPPTMLERLYSAIQSQSDGKNPPFRSFLLTDRLPSVGRVPPRQDDRYLYEEGDDFAAKDINDGTYSIVRWEKFRNISGYRVLWLGVVNVLDGQAKISKSFAEIRKGDILTPRLFLLSPLAIHEESVGPAKKDEFQLIPVQEGYRQSAYEYTTLGIRYKYDDAGPQPGAILNLSRLGKVGAKAMLIDRDRRSGTLWVIESKEEITSEYEVQ